MRCTSPRRTAEARRAILTLTTVHRNDRKESMDQIEGRIRAKLDQIPGAHRFIIDSTSPQGLGNGLLFANNFFVANQNGYGLGNADAAVVIVVKRRRS